MNFYKDELVHNFFFDEKLDHKNLMMKEAWNWHADNREYNGPWEGEDPTSQNRTILLCVSDSDRSNQLIICVQKQNNMKYMIDVCIIYHRHAYMMPWELKRKTVWPNRGVSIYFVFCYYFLRRMLYNDLIALHVKITCHDSQQNTQNCYLNLYCKI
jgi:hypothetical protein